MANRTDVMPRAAGAPPAVYPISVRPQKTALAPVPINDRFPIVVGQSLSLSYVASCFRLATTGYRQQYVDLLNELLEQDPHLYSVVQKRILSTANGRVEIVAAEVDKENENDRARAEEIRAFVAKDIQRIPDLAQNLAALMWGVYYSISASEIHWTRDSDGWHPERLSFIHSRRLAYPDYQSWDLYIWDQGMVYGWQSPWGSSPTNSGIFGLRVADFPGKFIVYAPQLRGDYPTRDGIGRQLATWSVLKRIAARNAAIYLERFAKPFMDIEYATSKDGKPRPAEPEDIDEAESAAESIGIGSLSAYTHPDSVKLNPKSGDGTGATPKITFKEWLDICNAEESKATLGGTLGTEVGRGGGNRSLGEVQERGELDLEQYDATTLAQALDRDLVSWIVRLNFPNEMHLAPKVMIHVDKEPDPKSQAELATMLTKIGAPVDLDNLSDDVGIKLVPKANESDPPRRSFVTDVFDPALVDPNLQSEESKVEEQEQQKAEADAKANAAKAMNGAPARTNGAPPAH